MGPAQKCRRMRLFRRKMASGALYEGLEVAGCGGRRSRSNVALKARAALVPVPGTGTINTSVRRCLDDARPSLN